MNIKHATTIARVAARAAELLRSPLCTHTHTHTEHARAHRAYICRLTPGRFRL